MGALEFQSETSNLQLTENVVLKALIDLANKIYQQREFARIDASQSLTMQALMATGNFTSKR